MLDQLASRYHLLPSQVLREADTLDVLVMDAAMSWEHYQRQRHQRQQTGQPPEPPPLSVNKMEEMIRRVREKK